MKYIAYFLINPFFALFLTENQEKLLVSLQICSKPCDFCAFVYNFRIFVIDFR